MSGRGIRALGAMLPVLALGAALGADPAVAATFDNFRSILVTDATGATAPFVAGRGEPYPSAIEVAGLSGVVSSVRVTLHGVGHRRPDDLDVLLAGPEGQRVVVLSDAGENVPLTGSELAFDDAGSPAPDNGGLGVGPYRPTNHFGGLGEPPDGEDAFPAPAPGAPRAPSFAAAFSGAAPNGTWRLYVLDDRRGRPAASRRAGRSS